MSKIDTSNWGEFKVGYFLDNKGNKIGSGLFEIVNSVAYHSKDIEEIDENNSIGLNYITRSKFNNGLKCKVIDNGNYKINPSGTISFGAENADFFYQKEKYITGNKMYYIDTSSLSELSCAFLKSILEATFTSNYSFSDGMIPSRIYNETIKLPIDVNGNPDWSYMEQYMANLEVAVSSSLTTLQSAKSQPKKKVETNEWKEFKVGDLFDAFLSKDDIQSKNFIEGDIPLVSSGKEKNGIIAHISNDKAKLWDAKTITVDMFGKVFYQPNSYYCVSHGRVNILVPKIQITELVERYIACVIETKTINKYEFSEMCTGNKLLNEIIKLPTKNEQPDWVYMENYIRNIEQKVNNSIDKILLTSKL